MKTSISELLEMQKKLYAQAYENIILRRLEKEHLFHDMKNHLLAIHRMAKDGQTQRLESYVDKLYESFGSAREYTGNRLVDYLISEKSDRARRQGIAAIHMENSYPASVRLLRNPTHYLYLVKIAKNILIFIYGSYIIYSMLHFGTNI